MTLTRAFLKSVAAILFAGATAMAAAQQPYPNKPVRLIVPYATGGSTSALAVLVAKQLSDTWGQQVFVDHKGGGNTVIASDLLAKAPPDGYTLMLTSNAHVLIPQLIATPFDPIKDFSPVATVAVTELILLVHPSLPASNLQEFIALAKARPGQINYASAGSSSATHIAGEMLATMTGIKIQHVPYKGSGPAIADLLGGQVQASFQTPIVAIPHVKSGKLKALAISGDNRIGALPQVPTFIEAGLPGFTVSTWFGIVAPAGTPTPVLDKVAQEVKKVMSNAEFKEKLAGLGLEPFYTPAAQFSELMKSDMARFSKVIKTSDIKLN